MKFSIKDFFIFLWWFWKKSIEGRKYSPSNVRLSLNRRFYYFQQNQRLLDSIRTIIREEFDEYLKGEIKGLINALETHLHVLRNKKKLTERELNEITFNVPYAIGDDYLGRLVDRIKSRGKDRSKSGGKAAFSLTLLYVQLATYRDSAIATVMMLLGKSGKEFCEISDVSLFRVWCFILILEFDICFWKAIDLNFEALWFN